MTSAAQATKLQAEETANIAVTSEDTARNLAGEAVSAVEPEVVEEAPTFKFFHVRVAWIQEISPSFRRVAFVGDDLSDWAHGGRDQRIKVVTRAPNGELPLHLIGDPDWWGQWRVLDAHEKAPIRTYTGRAFNYAHETAHGADEIVVDFVLHGDHGPASRWVGSTFIGDDIMLIGPSIRGNGTDLGVEWAPPATAQRLILAGDETAAPAICSIIEHAVREGRLSGKEPADIRAFIEVPYATDALPCEFADHPRVKLTWLPREGAAHGELLSEAVKSTVTSRIVHECSLMCDGGSCITAAAQPELEDVDIDAGILWEVQPANDSADAPSCYAWIAGEAGVVKGLRRHLVSTLGMDRRAVAFMGYWREGRAELS